MNKKDFWWWEEEDKTFTIEEIKELVDSIKEFNAGAIDEYLSNHVDKVLEEWKEKINN